MVVYEFIEENGHAAQHETGIRLLKKAAAECFGIDISEQDIQRDSLGKPYIDGGVNFSISHCNGLCCCTVSKNNCGIDCEKIRPYKDNVARRVMTQTELEYFNSLGESEKPFVFFLLWTLKEAYGKYTGRGLADMKNISFSFECGRVSSDRDELDFSVYRQGEYVISVCTERGCLPQCSFGERIY